MAHLPYLHHGYSPQGQARQLPRATRSTAPVIPVEISSKPATRAMERKLLLGKQQPAKDLATLLKKIRIPEEAQRILGNSSIPVVSLERLDVQAVALSSSLQPVVSLERLPPQTLPQSCSESSPVQQNGFRPGASDPDGAPIEWTEAPDGSASEEREQDSGFDCESIPDQPFILFDAEDWDAEDRAEAETFYLDPDPEQSVVIQLDPELQTDQELDAEVKDDLDFVPEDDGEELKSPARPSGCGPDVEEVEGAEHEGEPGPEEVEGAEHEDEPGPEEVEEVEHEDEPGPEKVEGAEHEDEPGPEEVEGAEHEDEPGPEEVEGAEHEDEPGPEEVEGAETKEMDAGTKPDRWKESESDDFCAVCLNGGDLLCCDRCPKVYHLSCHLPLLTSFPPGDWACTLCRGDQDPMDAYECEKVPSRGGAGAPYTLSAHEQRRCEKLALQLYSHALSAPFHEPVSPLAQNYYQIIRRPIDLSVIRRKLDKTKTLHYFSVEQFIDDVLLMFRNCATFNYPDSEVAQAGQSLETFFLDQLKEVFPERTFPNASLETMDRARLRWLRRKKDGRRRRCSSRGHRYYLM